MKKNLIPENYSRNDYAHEIVGAIIWNVEDFYDRWQVMRNRIVKRMIKTKRVPENYELAKNPAFGRIIKSAHRYMNESGMQWKKEKGDTWCARLWLADDVLETYESETKKSE